MMRTYLYMAAFLLPLSAQAECPNNQDVIDKLSEIHTQLAIGSKEPVVISKEPVVINDQQYIVERQDDSSAAEDIMAGNYEGFLVDRHEQDEEGKCQYTLKDNLPGGVRGSFILIPVTPK